MPKCLRTHLSVLQCNKQLVRQAVYTENYTNIVPINPLIVILGVIVLYSIGIFIGLLPTISLIKKTPAEINSKYDI